MAFDIVFRGGEVIDGTGKKPRYFADVGIRDGIVAALGDLADSETSSSVDATGCIVCPGFIDVHIQKIRYLVEEIKWPELARELQPNSWHLMDLVGLA